VSNVDYAPTRETERLALIASAQPPAGGRQELPIKTKPRESLDAPEDLPKQALGQVVFGKLEDEVPRVPDEAPPGLEQPLLQARQGPALDGKRQSEPAQEVAEIVGDDPEEQPHLVGPEAVAREARPMGGFFALLDPLLRRPALVVEMDDGAVRPGERGDDEADPGKSSPR